MDGIRMGWDGQDDNFIILSLIARNSLILFLFKCGIKNDTNLSIFY